MDVIHNPNLRFCHTPTPHFSYFVLFYGLIEHSSNPYCTEECRQIQMDLDEELEKKQLEESGKKMEE